MPRLVCPSWRWMTISGTPFARHLDGVGVAELVRRESSPDAGERRRVAQLFARGGRRPAAAAGWSGQDAEQRADGQRDAEVQPLLKLFPGPVVHTDFAAAAALAAADEDRAAAGVEVSLGERERFVDAQPGSPEHDDQPAQAEAVGRGASLAHDGRRSPRPWAGRRDTGVPCCAAVGRSGSPASWPGIGDGRRHRAARWT